MVDIHKLPDGTETYFCDFCEDNFSQKKVAETHQNECEHLLVQSNLTSDYLAFTNNSKLKLSDGFGRNGKQVRVEHINKISISKMYKHIIVNDNDETEKVDRIIMSIEFARKSSSWVTIGRFKGKFGPNQYDDLLTIKELLEGKASDIIKQKEDSKDYKGALRLCQLLNLKKDVKRLTKIIAIEYENNNEYEKAIKNYDETGLSADANRLRMMIAKDFEESERYEEAFEIYKELGEESYTIAINRLRQKAHELMETDKQKAIIIYESIGEDTDRVNSKKIEASLREDALDYDSAIDIWEELGLIQEAARVRKMQADMGSVKVAQSVIQGDQITNTEVKDSVINKSNISPARDDKFAKLERLADMKEKGLIDDDEFKQMKKEILGK